MPMGVKFVPLGVANTSRGFCVHKSGVLCTQVGGFVSDAPTGASLGAIGYACITPGVVL